MPQSIAISMSEKTRKKKDMNTKQVNSYSVGAPQIYPAVEHIWLMELLAFTLVLQTNSKIPVCVAIAKGHIKRNSVCILVTFFHLT